MKRNRISILLCILLLIVSVALSACSAEKPEDDIGEQLSGENNPQNNEGDGEIDGEEKLDGETAPDNDGAPDGETSGDGEIDGEIDGEEKPDGDGEAEGDGETSGDGEAEKGDTGSDVVEGENTGDTIINENVTNNDITINGSGSNSAYAAAKGLRSAVSIYCKFEKTVISGSWFNQTETLETYYSTGAGVIYKLYDDGSAFLITNFHVVYDADSESGISEEILIYLYGMESDGYAIPASFVGGSANYDIAVLRIEKSDILLSAKNNGVASQIELGSSDSITPGASVLAIGNPVVSDFAGISVTRGVISVDSEYITMMASDNSKEVSFRVMRIDAAVNGGNSGGGLFDEYGRLIGIVNAKVSSASIDGVGYAIPVSIARAAADNVIDNCFNTEKNRVIRVTVGVGIDKGEYFTEFDTETGLIYKREKAVVASVTEGSIAEGKLLIGDAVKSVTIGDRTIEINRVYMMIDAMIDVREGDIISFLVERDGEEIIVEIEAIADAFIEY